MYVKKNDTKDKTIPIPPSPPKYNILDITTFSYTIFDILELQLLKTPMYTGPRGFLVFCKTQQQDMFHHAQLLHWLITATFYSLPFAQPLSQYFICDFYKKIIQKQMKTRPPMKERQRRKRKTEFLQNQTSQMV